MAKGKAKKITSNKKNNIVKNTVTFSSNELINLIKIIAIVCAFLLVFYFVTVLVKKNDKKVTPSDENTTATIQYSKIIVGEILNRSENEYYVLAEKENDPYISLYKSYFSTYSSKDDALRYYTIDLSDIFNNNNIGEENYIDGNDPSSYKFSQTTLLKINGGSIESIYNSSDEISAHLESLIK